MPTYQNAIVMAAIVTVSKISQHVQHPPAAVAMTLIVATLAVVGVSSDESRIRNA